jgi:hypothetical protein
MAAAAVFQQAASSTGEYGRNLIQKLHLDGPPEVSSHSALGCIIRFDVMVNHAIA